MVTTVVMGDIPLKERCCFGVKAKVIAGFETMKLINWEIKVFDPWLGHSRIGFCPRVILSFSHLN